MIQTIIFSKNRPAQLDLLLRSIEHYAPSLCNVSVLYTCDKEYWNGYFELVKKYQWVRFNREGDFKKDLNIIFGEEPYTMFLCDDDVFKNNFYEDKTFWQFARNSNIYCLSLRLGKHIVQTCTNINDLPLPQFGNDGTWQWSTSIRDWGNPVSMCGHVFRTRQIAPDIENLLYSNPNVLENEMKKNPLPIPLMLCYDESKCFNAPLNIVSVSSNYWSAGISCEYINEQFCLGKKISLSNLNGIRNLSPHESFEIIWE